MGKDISKKTVAILLVLAIILSVTLTLTSLKNEFSSGYDKEEKHSATQSAQVSLTVQEPPDVEGAEVKLIVTNG